jgi:hypothetical protein
MSSIGAPVASGYDAGAGGGFGGGNGAEALAAAPVPVEQPADAAETWSVADTDPGSATGTGGFGNDTLAFNGGNPQGTAQSGLALDDGAGSARAPKTEQLREAAPTGSFEDRRQAQAAKLAKAPEAQGAAEQVAAEQVAAQRAAADQAAAEQAAATKARAEKQAADKAAADKAAADKAAADKAAGREKVGDLTIQKNLDKSQLLFDKGENLRMVTHPDGRRMVLTRGDKGIDAVHVERNAGKQDWNLLWHKNQGGSAKADEKGNVTWTDGEGWKTTRTTGGTELQYQPKGGQLGLITRPDGTKLNLFYEKGEWEKGSEAKKLSSIMLQGPSSKTDAVRDFWQQRAGGRVEFSGSHNTWGGHVWNKERDGGSAVVRPDGTIDIQNRPGKTPSERLGVTSSGKVYSRANEDISIAPTGEVSLKNLDNGTTTELEPSGRPVAIGNDKGNYRITYDAKGDIAAVTPDGKAPLPGELAQFDGRLVLTQRGEDGKRRVTELESGNGRSQVFNPDVAGSNDAFIDAQRAKLVEAGVLPQSTTIGQMRDMWEKATRERIFSRQTQFAARMNALTDVPHPRRNEEFYGFRRELQGGFDESKEMMKLLEEGDWRKLDEKMRQSRWTPDPAKIDPANPATYNPFHQIDGRMRNWTPHPPRFHEIVENFVGGAWDRLKEIPAAIMKHPGEAAGVALLTVLAPEVMVPALIGVGGFKAGYDAGNASIKVVDGYRTDDPAKVLQGFREMGGAGTDIAMLVGGEALAARTQGAKGAARAGEGVVRDGAAAQAPKVLKFGEATSGAAEIAAVDARNALTAGKAAEAGRVMDARRASEIAAIKDPARFMDELRHLPPAKLRELAKLEPRVVDRFDAALEGTQRGWLDDINGVLSRHGLEATGPTKRWESMVNKLDAYARWNAQNGKLLPDGSPLPSAVGDLTDLNRAHVLLTKFDQATLRGMVMDMQAQLKAKYPNREFKFDITDYADPRNMADPNSMWKGAINVHIKDVTSGVPRKAFEIQFKPKHLTEFNDTAFAAGGGKSLNLHDAVYKGTSLIKTDGQFAAVGRGLNPGRTMTDAEAIAAGRQAIEATSAQYKHHLNSAIDQATRGTKNFDYAGTAGLREQILRIRKALSDQGGEIPAGLAGH